MKWTNSFGGRSDYKEKPGAENGFVLLFKLYTAPFFLHASVFLVVAKHFYNPG